MGAWHTLEAAGPLKRDDGALEIVVEETFDGLHCLRAYCLM